MYQVIWKECNNSSNSSRQITTGWNGQRCSKIEPPPEGGGRCSENSLGQQGRMNLPQGFARFAFDANMLAPSVIHDAADSNFKVAVMLQLMKSRNKSVPREFTFIRHPRGKLTDVFPPVFRDGTCDQDGYGVELSESRNSVFHRQYLLQNMYKRPPRPQFTIIAS